MKIWTQLAHKSRTPHGSSFVLFAKRNGTRMFIKKGLCKKDVTPLLTHSSYVFLALTHRYRVLLVVNYLKLNNKIQWQAHLDSVSRLFCLGVWNGRNTITALHDDVVKWRHFLRYWPFVRGIHWSPVNSPHKGQCRRALMFSLISVWINGWVHNRGAGDLRRNRAHYDVIVMRCLTAVSWYDS